jgi:hypothetical protein
MSRIFAIPDIHGRLDLLNKLMEKLYVEQKLDLSVDKLIFLGDMVDRGSDSYGVIEFIKRLQEIRPDNVIALAGNHEWMMIHYYIRGTNEDKELWEWNGGLQTIDSYQRAGFNKPSEDHLRWLAFLPLKHEEPGFFFSHAPAPREAYRNIMNRGLPDFTPDELTWTYHTDERGVARDFGNGIVGYCGHIHALRQGIMAPRFYDHYVYLDSGCGCSPKAPLVAAECGTKNVVYAWP